EGARGFDRDELVGAAHQPPSTGRVDEEGVGCVAGGCGAANVGGDSLVVGILGKSQRFPYTCPSRCSLMNNRTCRAALPRKIVTSSITKLTRIQLIGGTRRLKVSRTASANTRTPTTVCPSAHHPASRTVFSSR